MEIYTIDFRLILWTLFCAVVLIFAGYRIYRFFRKRDRNNIKDLH